MVSSIMFVSVYFLPSIIALFGEEKNIRNIFFLNLLTGWTIILWFFWLFQAAASVDAKKARIKAERENEKKMAIYQIQEREIQKEVALKIALRKERIRQKYKNKSIEAILLAKDLNKTEKKALVKKRKNYSEEELEELIKTAEKEIKKAKLSTVKRKISQKAQELHGYIFSDSREPIPDNIQNRVWNRDNGKCVKCGSREKLEFDHIIPASKGGANTARNIQLLCERCNREKSNNIG